MRNKAANKPGGSENDANIKLAPAANGAANANGSSKQRQA